ncbi:Metalloproteinase inhibitor 4 [Gracilariopsis chorda]|uniref:Metalloproteinase inhibitor 4 n=1 Tax=Gracilariopsis chorda TaxID=448386 RepID=A0A2V3IHP6_9FLOR|nr:Metalloproteinase inhibitor 4 [Gracilariopsis chorda]|eukprot:PXF40660.1 Metalloproteinase inhibitor 4 [Gracilariopsis chorda]
MKLFLQALITALLLVSSLGCSCFPVSFEKSYCDSSTSFRATVLAETDNCVGKCHPIDDQMEGAITYILKVSEVFRGTMPEDEVAYMRTPVNSGLCGITLGVGTEYVFNLPYIAMSAPFQCPSEYFSIGLCDSIEEWESLADGAKQFIADNVNNGQKLCGPGPPLPSPLVIEMPETTPTVTMTPQALLTA